MDSGDSACADLHVLDISSLTLAYLFIYFPYTGYPSLGIQVEQDVTVPPRPTVIYPAAPLACESRRDCTEIYMLSKKNSGLRAWILFHSSDYVPPSLAASPWVMLQRQTAGKHRATEI